MSNLQLSSLKITKEPKKDSKDSMTFMCGGCPKRYKSYPALYLHIKRKHQGVRPPNTKIAKPTQPTFVANAQTGRPSKPLHNVDDLSQTELALEETQNELLGFLGEKLMIIGSFDDKMKLEEVVGKIRSIQKESKDKWFTALQDEGQAFFTEFGENTDLDFEEEFRNLDPNNGLRVLLWFVLWLVKNFVKKEFISDLCLIVSRIWKVLDDTQLQIQDLDNKLVWKKAMAECKLMIGELVFFRRDEELIYEFIQKVCQLIGRAFEQDN